MTLKTLVFADDVKIRWMMLLASFGWVALIIVLPETFERPYYAKMAAFMPTWLWAVLFFVHGIGALWRIYDRVEREKWGLVVNGLGVAVWVTAVVCQNIASNRVVTGSNILEVVACMFLLGTFTATGYSSKSTTA